jgi:uncharacterized protein (TIGR03067 family)
MLLHCLMGLMAGVVIGGDMPQETTVKELEKLQGVWKIARVEQDGKTDNSLKEGTVTISGIQFTTRSGETVLRKGTVALDPFKEPKTIDLTYEDGPQKGKSSRGIYSLDGTCWTLVFGPPGKSRPTAIQPKPNSGQRLMVLQSSGVERIGQPQDPQKGPPARLAVSPLGLAVPGELAQRKHHLFFLSDQLPIKAFTVVVGPE